MLAKRVRTAKRQWLKFEKIENYFGIMCLVPTRNGRSNLNSYGFGYLFDDLLYVGVWINGNMT